jgi:hypothetical protein
VSDAKLDVKPTAKMWEPLRAYEKKLVTIMHKGMFLICVGVLMDADDDDDRCR